MLFCCGYTEHVDVCMLQRLRGDQRLTCGWIFYYVDEL